MQEECAHLDLRIKIFSKLNYCVVLVLEQVDVNGLEDVANFPDDLREVLDTFIRAVYVFDLSTKFGFDDSGGGGHAERGLRRLMTRPFKGLDCYICRGKRIHLYPWIGVRRPKDSVISDTHRLRGNNGANTNAKLDNVLYGHPGKRTSGELYDLELRKI